MSAFPNAPSPEKVAPSAIEFKRTENAVRTETRARLPHSLCRLAASRAVANTTVRCLPHGTYGFQAYINAEASTSDLTCKFRQIAAKAGMCRNRVRGINAAAVKGCTMKRFCRKGLAESE